MRKIILNIGIILYFFSGYVYIMPYINTKHQLVLSVALFLILISLKKNKIIKKIDTLDSLFIFFLISIFLSFMFNKEKEILYVFGGMSLFGLIFNVYLVINKKLYNYLLKKIKVLILYPYILLIFYSCLKYPITLSGYKGVFLTPTGIGGTASFACVIVLTFLVEELIQNKIKKGSIISNILILIFLFLILLISTNRSGIIVTLILFFLSLGIVLRRLIINKKNIRVLIIIMIIVLLISLVYLLGEEIIKNIINKFIRKINDPLDGRREFWKEILKNINFFGNGERNMKIAAHNTFLSLMDQYGILAFISWTSYCIVYLYRSFKLIFNYKYDNLRYLPLYSIINFMTISITEGMMLKSIMLLVLFCVPLLKEKN